MSDSERKLNGREMRKVAVRRDVHKERTRGSGGGTGDEVCPLASGQLVAGRVAGGGDLWLQRALSLFTLRMKETAGAPPTQRLPSIVRVHINEVNVRNIRFE